MLTPLNDQLQRNFTRRCIIGRIILMSLIKQENIGKQNPQLFKKRRHPQAVYTSRFIPNISRVSNSGVLEYLSDAEWEAMVSTDICSVAPTITDLYINNTDPVFVITNKHAVE